MSRVSITIKRISVKNATRGFRSTRQRAGGDTWLTPRLPLAPSAGPRFVGVGDGACRDGSGKEPPFFTDEHGPLQAGETEVRSEASLVCLPESPQQEVPII